MFVIIHLKKNTMKTLFFFLLMGISLMASAQRSWIEGTGNATLYTPTDKVGIGTNARLDEKLVIQSLSGETPLALRGSSIQNLPFVTMSTTLGNPFWKLYAGPVSWSIGISSDSARATIYVKPLLQWIRINSTVSMTKLIAPAVTTDSITINKFLKLPPQSVTPASVFGNVYLKASDSCLYYYNGKAWKKFSVL